MEQAVKTQAVTLAKEIQDIYADLKPFEITTDERFNMAAEELKEIKTRARLLDETRRSMTRPLDESKEKIMAFFRKPTEWLANAERTIKSAMLGFEDIRRKKLAAEQAEADRQAKADEAKRKAELAKEAEKALDEGKTHAAVTLIQEAEQLEIAPVKLTAPKTPGVSTRTTYKARVVDFAKLSDEYKMPNQMRLNELARFSKGQNPPAGVEFYAESSMAVKAG